MSYWSVPEDLVYGILGVSPHGYDQHNIDNMLPEDVPKTDETRSVYYGELTDSESTGNLESAIERVLDDVKAKAKATLNDYLVYKGVDPEDYEHDLWYENMLDDFAHETLHGLRGGEPEYNEINLTYLPQMFEELGEDVDQNFFNVMIDESNSVGNESWNDWVVFALKEAKDKAVEMVRSSPAAWTEEHWKEAMDNSVVVMFDDIDDSFNIYYEGHLIEQAIRQPDEAQAFAKEIAKMYGLSPGKEVFYYNYEDDDTATLYDMGEDDSYDEDYSKHMFWTPSPKPDPRQERLPFAASTASYRGTPQRRVALTQEEREWMEDSGMLPDDPGGDPWYDVDEESYKSAFSKRFQDYIDNAADEYPGKSAEELTEMAYQNHIWDGGTESEWNRAIQYAGQIMREPHPGQERLPHVASAKKRRTAAKTQPPKKLARKIKQLLDAAQAEWDEAIGRPDPIYNDVHIRVGKQEVNRYLDCGGTVAITYDGAGYDMLSYEGEMEHMGGSQIRRDIINAAAEMGYFAEDQNSWSMCFYPDESVKPLGPLPKKETPAWLREQLEEEFGPFGGGEDEPALKPEKKYRPEEQRRMFEEMGIKTSNARRRHAADYTHYTQVEDYERDVLGLEEEAKRHMSFVMGAAPGMPLDVASNPNYLVEYVAEAMNHPEWLEADHATHPVWDWADEVILETFGPLSQEW
jgi:hypothetical protein